MVNVTRRVLHLSLKPSFRRIPGGKFSQERGRPDYHTHTRTGVRLTICHRLVPFIIAGRLDLTHQGHLQIST